MNDFIKTVINRKNNLNTPEENKVWKWCKPLEEPTFDLASVLPTQTITEQVVEKQNPMADDNWTLKPPSSAVSQAASRRDPLRRCKAPH